MSNDTVLSSILAFLWGFGTIGVTLLVVFAIRLRLYAKGRMGDIGIIVLDALVSKNVFLVFALGMVAYSRYTGFRFPVACWTIVIGIWLFAIWASVVRIILWFVSPAKIEEDRVAKVKKELECGNSTAS